MTAPRPVPREAVLIVNARSRKGQDLFREAKQRLEAAGIRLIDAHAVKDPRRLKQRVDQAVADGAPMVIVGGGDGSLSCSVDFVVDHDCVFALLPLGTANSFARTLGIPLDLEGAVETIAGGRRRRIDLGVINGDYFVNSAAMGLAPMIADSVPHKLKKYLGRFGYLVWAIWCLARFRPFTVRIDGAGESRSLTALELRIANGRFHGGVEVVETTDVDSGDIVVQAVIGHYKRKLVWNWFATYFRLAARHETVEEIRGRKLEVTTRPELGISIDGEVLTRTPATVEIAAKAIEVVVPQFLSQGERDA
jgi:YegS/Rv2252/BmrU family lipid kinase